MPYSSKKKDLRDALVTWIGAGGLTIPGGIGKKKRAWRNIPDFPALQVTPAGEDAEELTQLGRRVNDSVFEVVVFVKGENGLDEAMDLCGQIVNRVELKDPSTGAYLGNGALNIITIAAVAEPYIATEEVNEDKHLWIVSVLVRYWYTRGSA